ncbi:MAG: DEAD/DEAH box helicase [Alphaproteobacteria bacterium]|nr:DEAD/DEAH box helicase [Alphaproteobacteria bacterium]
MSSFNDFALPQALQHAIEKLNFTIATPIQMGAIPPALEGKDILGTAQTGTGKTAAFAIPLIAKLMANPTATAIVLLPTRELAAQVEKAVIELSAGSKLLTALLIGGDSMGKQLNQLQKKPRVIIGTPGRVNDHLKRGTLKLSHAEVLVLDETDRMLDMGFGIQIETIIEKMPKQRQTLMFSATMPGEIVKLAGRYLNHPVRISVGETNQTAANVELKVVETEDGKKYEHLIRELGERQGSVIIFVKTKYGADRLAKRLRGDDYESDALHGDLRQHKRDKVTRNFREQKYRILVATDVAARGLDIPHIEHVINYDLPQAPEDFIHRIGRTGRAGAKGQAVSFVAPSESRKWFAIERLLDPTKKQGKSSSGNYEKRGRAGSDGEGYKGKSFGKKFGGKKFGDKKRFERDNRGDDDTPRFEKKREFFKKDHVNKPEGERDEQRSFAKKPFKKERSFDRVERGGFERNEERRDDRKPFGERKSFGDKKPFGKKPFNKGSFDPLDKREGFERERNEFNRDAAERKPFGKKPFKKEWGNKERSFDRTERSGFDRDDREPKPFGKKPFNKERRFDNDSERKPFGKKSFDKERSFGNDNRREDRRDDRRSENRFGKSEGGNKPFGKKSFGNKGGKPSFGGKPAFGKRRDEEGAGKPRSFHKKRG